MKFMVLVMLTALLIFSALAVIYSKYRSRLLFIEIRKMERKLDQYDIEWGRLQLELTTHTEENRIERIAKQKLQLKMPEKEKTIYLKP